MQSGNIPLIEMYLTAHDYPQRRALVSLLKRQQENAAKNPHKMTIEDLIKNPAMGTAAANLFKALSGFSKAQGQLLQSLTLDGTTDTLTTAPVQQITSKSEVSQIASVIPAQISQNEEQAKFGNDRATEILNAKHGKEIQRYAI